MLSTYVVKVAGCQYIGQYRSACEAIIVAQALYGVHNASARRVAA